jgi:hypothetical protein
VGAVRLFLAVFGALALGVLAGSASGQGSASYDFATVVGGFSAPVFVASAPGDPSTLYVVEQAGTIKIVKNGAVAGTFLDIRSRIKSGGEQGLLSVAFHPQYATNHRFYVDYTDTNGDTRVVEFRSSNGIGQPATARQLLSSTSRTTTTTADSSSSTRAAFSTSAWATAAAAAIPRTGRRTPEPARRLRAAT